MSIITSYQIDTGSTASEMDIRTIDDRNQKEYTYSYSEGNIIYVSENDITRTCNEVLCMQEEAEQRSTQTAGS